LSVYTYKVSLGREDFVEEGTVLAKDEHEAKEKLRQLDFNHVHVRKVSGFSAFLKKFSADIR